MVINRKFGDFVLLQRIAVGGQSEVFLAMKRGPETYSRPVVIKAMPGERKHDKRFVHMFYREAYISSRFHHPHVINVHDAKLVDGEHCMLMDFIAGQTVADIAQRGYQRKSPPTLKQVAQIIADACSGLQYVHQFRDLDGQQYCVVHRDISPQNLMVTYQGVTLLFDFGIAHIMGMDEEGITLAGGKFAYMSPEQAMGKPSGPSSDIFSMGIILFELATGYRLFRRPTQPEVIRAITEDPIPAPRELRGEISPFLEQIIMRALAREPADRYPSAGDMRDDLMKYLDMMSEHQDIRKGLGTYVAAMFRDERQAVAEILLQAPELEHTEPSETLSSYRTGTEPETTMELSRKSSDSNQPKITPSYADLEPSVAIAAADTTQNTQISQLQKQRQILHGVIVVLMVAVAILIAM